MRFLPAILSNFLLMAAAFGLGSLLQPLFRRDFSKFDRFAVTALSGLGLLGTLFFLVGMIRFSLATVLVILVPLAALGAIRLARESKEFLPALRRARPPSIPLAIICVLLAVTAIAGLAEPVGDIKMDAIAYHFLGPRVWIRDAAIHPLPDECHASFPANVETLFAGLTTLGGTRAPEFFALLAYGLLLLVAAGFALRMGLDSSGAWWAAALVATMPVVYRGSYGGFNDAVLAGFLLLALRLAFDARETRDYLLPGLFAGLAMGTKYTAIITFLLILLCALLRLASRRPGERELVFRGSLLFAIVAALIASPWYLRNWLVLGSPIYPPTPMLLHFFSVKYMPPAAIQALAAFIRKEGDGMGHSLSSFLLLPFNFTFHPANFLNGAGGVGIALLALAPFGLLSRWKDPLIRILSLFVFLQTLAWFLAEQEARFIIHLYVILAALAIWGWRYVASQAPKLGRLLSGAAIACSLLYGLFMIVSARVDDLHAAVSRKFETQRRSREVPFLESFAYLNSDPSVAKVLVLAPRFPTFYLQKNYLKPVGRFGEESVPNALDTQALLQNAPALGITHVVDARVDGNDFLISTPPSNLSLVLEAQDQRIYRVLSTPLLSRSRPSF
jgi:dolichyl-phosphate-mannose-protein mannosyltransferase